MIARAIVSPIRGFMSKCNRFVLGHTIPSDIEPKIRIYLNRGRFTLKSAETLDELTEVLRLRYDVFHREFKNKKNPFGYDVDIYDEVCDHLIIRDDETGMIVGTYRAISSEFSRSFYSQNEFHLEKFLSLPGGKLELGRACIHSQYRNGIIINLLWRGIAQYMKEAGAQYLFGCASVKTTDPKTVQELMHSLKKEDALSDEFSITPTLAYQMKELRELPSLPDDMPATQSILIPPLVRSYLKAGAKLHGEPALDREFQCVDFLAVLRLDDMSHSFQNKYKV